MSRFDRWKHRDAPVWIRACRITAGSLVLLAGIVMLVTPGPGIVAIIAGLAILAKDIRKAEHALEKVVERAEAAKARALAKRGRHSESHGHTIAPNTDEAIHDDRGRKQKQRPPVRGHRLQDVPDVAREQQSPVLRGRAPRERRGRKDGTTSSPYSGGSSGGGSDDLIR